TVTYTDASCVAADTGAGGNTSGVTAIYAAGTTGSADFPAVAAASVIPPTSGVDGQQPVFGGMTDAFVTELDRVVGTFTQSTYLGGAQNDAGLALAVSGSAVWVGGNTSSPTGFSTNAIDATLSGVGPDGFITKFNSALTQTDLSSYFGGSGVQDSVNAIAAISNDTVVIAGTTDSNDLYSANLTTGSAFQAGLFSANAGGFAAKISGNAQASAA